MKERTLLFLKPEGLIKDLAGDILNRMRRIDDVQMIGAKLVAVTEGLAAEHYIEHKDKPFYPRLIGHLTGQYHHGINRVLAFVFEGEDIIAQVRKIVGATMPEDAHPRSIRGAYGRICKDTGLIENVVHASANPTDAAREIALWFRPEELMK
jgi:nucleoside-diphosphate kinase